MPNLTVDDVNEDENGFVIVTPPNTFPIGQAAPLVPSTQINDDDPYELPFLSRESTGGGENKEDLIHAIEARAQ